MQTEYSKVLNLQRCEELMQINCLGRPGQVVTLIRVWVKSLITQMCLSSLAVDIKL